MTKFYITTLASLFGIMVANAQLNLPTRNIGGKEYYYRVVQKKETIYGISKELGIPKEELIKYNPSVANGLQKDQILYFPVEQFRNKNTDIATRPSSFKHTVKRGETLYGISKMYGISISDLLLENPNARMGLNADTELIIPINKSSEKVFPYTVKAGDTLYRLSVTFNVKLNDILEINPGISPDNFQSGMTILIPAANKETNKNNTPETIFVQNKVEKGDSFESISNEYGVPQEHIKEANPNCEELKKGSYLAVPISNLQKDEIHNVNTNQELAKLESINISVLLPFESESATPSKQSLIYKEFYRGFLMAVNDCKNKEKINLSVYSINSSNLSSILNKDDVRKSNLIFTPAEDELIKPIAEFGEKNNVNVINSFSVNDETFYENGNYITLNTPSSYMYSAVREYIDEKFPDYQIVYLEDGSEEKPLIKYLKLCKTEQSTFDLSDSNTFECSKKTLFVPTSSSKSTLSKIKSLIDRLNASTTTSEFKILGYPEWTLYTQYENFLRSNNVYVFSRYSIEKDKSLAKKYQYWFNEQPLNAIPRMHELGYDAATYFFNALHENNNDFNKSTECAEGKQISINLSRSSNWGGFVNTACYIYQYTSKGLKKHILK